MNLPGGWRAQGGKMIAALNLGSEEPIAPRKGDYASCRASAICERVERDAAEGISIRQRSLDALACAGVALAIRGELTVFMSA